MRYLTSLQRHKYGDVRVVALKRGVMSGRRISEACGE
jgi:hypothetical protein